MQGRNQMVKRFGPALLILGASITGIGCAGVAGTQNSGPSASAPSITAQPTAQTVIGGQSATFSVAATGTAPLSYQWNKNGAAVSGATSSSYTTPATTSSDNGAQFAVVVSNAAGSITSNSATLTVNAGPVAPSITTQPTSQTVTAGQAATFTVTATGTAPLGYQWDKNGAAIPGATSSGYTTPATTSSDNGAQFAVVVSNATGSVTSNTAMLTVNPSALLTATPSSATFPNVVTGTSSSQTITLTNGGSVSTTISQASVSGAGFSLTGLAPPTTIASGTSATFNVVFAPTTAGTATGSVSLVSNASGSPLGISLSGTAVAPTFLLGANPSSLSFGNVNLGSSSSLTTRLTNNGNSNVTISGVTVTGSQFNSSGVATGTTLAPNQSVTLSVAFTPIAAGSVTGSVSVVSNATNSPATITLAGSGQPATAPGQWITGFYSAGNGVLSIANIPWTKYTHINHFAAAPGVDSSGNGNGTVELHYLTTTEITQIVLAAHAAGKKVIVTIKDNDSHLGAFGQSTSPTLLATFVSNIANFVNSNGYDGVDFDWEQQINSSQYESLLSSMRATFGTSKLILTDMGNWNNMPAVAAASYSDIDQINLMCYDMEKQTYSWHNDALFQNGDTTKMTCDWRVGAFTTAGVPKAKIGIGIPFYGYRWTGCTQPLVNACTLGGYASYSAIVTNSTWYAGGANHHWDSTYSGDYLSVSSSNMFITYNDTTSIQGIVNWQKAQGFGGFMTFTVDYEYLSGQTGNAGFPLSTALCQQTFGTCP